MITRLLLTVCAMSVFAFSVELPNVYRGLLFGSDTLKVRTAFPSSENQKHSVFRRSESIRGIAFYTLVFPKGSVDSSRLYFVDNRFALAVEYWFSGKEFFEEAIGTLSTKYGVFSRVGDALYRQDGEYGIRIQWLEKQKMTMVSYYKKGLADKLQKRISDARPTEGEIIDSTLKVLEKELKTLDGKKK